VAEAGARAGEDPSAGSDTPFLVALSGVPGIGAASIASLLARFGSAERAWRAPEEKLANVIGAGRGALIGEARRRVTAERAMAAVEAAGARVIVRGAPEYPVLLSETARPPEVLFVRGRFALLHAPCIAIVGTRRMTNYGGRVTRLLAEGLADAGVTVVSGLARGVDTRAHESVLAASGATAAVLGTGTDVAFPSSNRRLLEDVAADGCVVSEYPPGTPAMRGHFPARNRVIAGLSVATVVVEAGEVSGSLITAQIALDEGRTVCAVPGVVGAAASAGTHALLRAGASAVTSAAEVLADAGLDPAPTLGASPRATRNDADAAAVLEQLRQGPMAVDDLASVLRSSASEIVRALTVLEIQGLATPGGAEWYAA
jgi:DNA processing protein